MSFVGELLLQPYPLDPGSIEFLIEETVRYGRDAPIRVVSSLLARGQLTDVDRQNIGHYVRRACASVAIRRRFSRTLKRKGRCPRNERTWLRSQMEQVSPPRQSARRITPPQAIERLDLKKISGSIAEFPEVIDRIGSISSDTKELRIALGEFTYAAALAVIAQWILAHRLTNRHDFVECSEEMETYLENIRFGAALRNPEIVISPDPMDWAVGLTRINRDQPTEKVTEKIVDILHTFVNPKPEERQALLVMISEMIENVHRHAESPVDGFAVAQVYPKRLKMGITLVDAGIGVRKSFLEGDPSVPVRAFKSDEDFLLEAVKLHSTSKRSRHSGYGLYLLAELIARNRGTFLLTSGAATILGYQRARKVAFDVYHHSPWQGTIVSVIIDLNNDLPLLKIYREMPAPVGYENDDIFT